MNLTINGVRIDNPNRAYVIGEASGNHGRDYATAESLVVAAAFAGANCVKFQTFTAESICADVPILFGHDAAHDAWCNALGVSRMRELFSKGGLPRDWHAPLKATAESLGIDFISTPFSVDDARFLVDEIGVSALKIASGDLTFQPLLHYAVSTGLPMIISTGGAYLEEVAGILADHWDARRRIVFLHCTSSYPADAVSANLLAMRKMQKVLDVPIGYSDHTLSVDSVPMMAAALGAVVYEKHIRLSDDHSSVDAGHSLNPEQFKTMVGNIRAAQGILGDGVKEPHKSEMHDRKWARRSPIDWLRPTEEARSGEWK